MRGCFQFLAAGIALVFPVIAAASGLEQLQAFLHSSHSARGVFVQVVISKSARKPQQSTGFFAFQRPGKFRWSYEKPYRQLLVSDGTKLWSYDPDLNQVAISKLGSALGSSPAALLAGKDLEKNFELKDGKVADGFEYVEAKPKGEDSGFERMSIAFTDNKPVTMEIHDNFGQVTRLSFAQLVLNPELPDSLFHFVAPKGADVVGE